MSYLIDRQAVIDLLKQMRKDGDMVPWEGKVVFARIRKLPTIQPEKAQLSQEGTTSDLISRQAAIRWVKTECNPYGNPTLDFESGKKVIEHLEQMPSAQPERLSDDDFETIRIHLNAYKAKLCNQHRWEEAEEYQRIINRFIAFASAQPEIVRCKDCVYHAGWDYCEEVDGLWYDDDYCCRGEKGERREE